MAIKEISGLFCFITIKSVSGFLLFYGVSNFSWADMHDILILQVHEHRMISVINRLIALLIIRWELKFSNGGGGMTTKSMKIKPTRIQMIPY